MDSLRLGIDIGGTFTDFTLFDTATRALFVEKVLTTPNQPDQAVFEGIRRLSAKRPKLLEQAQAVIHATTLLTNVVIERKGARIGLLTTAGFRDVLEMGREMRYDVYDPFIRFAEPLVPRPLRLGIDERVLADGSVKTTLNDESLREACDEFARAGVEAVAICFLHSYRNAEHETSARQRLGSWLPGIEVSISSEVHPEPKEYERTSTTVVDAYVKPIASKYLTRFASQLAEQGYGNPLYVMLSNGGTASADTARRFPVQLIESGPAAGVEAVAHHGRLIGASRLLSFDMGGTTAKLCLVKSGEAARTRSFEVDRIHRFKAGSGMPIAVPVYDLLEIGAGGGSIARVNSLRLLQVGPDSAGSSPGPACYGLSGSEPTVTDADVALGFLDPDFFLGGAMQLDRQAAVRAIEDRLAKPLGMSIEEAAAGIHDIVNEMMASAARVYVAEKGEAPNKLSLVAFGGAGPVHAVGLARKLGCREVIVPPMPGVMSSFGLLAAPLAFERARSLRLDLDTLDTNAIAGISDELAREAAAEIGGHGQIEIKQMAEMWLSGQDYPLEIHVHGTWRDADIKRTLRAAFETEYRRLYGRVEADASIELVTLRVQALQRATPPQSAGGSSVIENAEKKPRKVYFRGAGWVTATVHQRASLAIGAEVVGPAVIEERESTFVIGIGDRLKVDEWGNLRVALADPV